MSTEKKKPSRGRPRGPETYPLTVRVREVCRGVLAALADEWHCSPSHAARVVLDEALSSRKRA